MAFLATIKEEINSLFKLLNPYKAAEFFKDMKIRSVKYMLAYLMFMGLFLFTGYFLNIHYKLGFGEEPVCSFAVSIESAFLSYITLVLLPILAGFLISFFGKSLTGKDTKADEIISIIGYSMLFILFSGLFRMHIVTIILHYIAIAYGIYLLYVAINARFGFDRAAICFVFFLIVIALMFMILFSINSALSNLLIWFVVDLLHMKELPLETIKPWCH